MKLVYRVQHTVGRDEGLHRLLDHLPLAVEVVSDHEGHDPNPWRNYLRCLQNPPPRATHMAILQDDVLPCNNFDIRLREVIKEKPDQILSLFVGNLRGAGQKEYRKAQIARSQWCAISSAARIFHVVALVWPVEAAAAFLDWYEVTKDKIPARQPHRSDDQVFGYWIRTGTPRRTVWATVPCLVEHPDDVPQVARKRQRASDPGRRAISFAG